MAAPKVSCLASMNVVSRREFGNMLPTFDFVKQLFTKRNVVASTVGIILAVMYGQLLLTARWDSMSVDEGNHIYTGYMQWTRGDFGLNPEHPPLVKFLAALPLLRMGLHAPEPLPIFYKGAAYTGGRELLSGRDKTRILFRARAAVGLLAVLLAFLAFVSAREMFGLGAGFLALILAAFDPNLLGLGTLVTTDTGVACFLLATVYTFYRYVKAPSVLRLLLVGFCAGFALAAKHNGIFLFPILVLLSISEIFRTIPVDRATGSPKWRRPTKLFGALACIFLLSITTLWAFYGFRFSARPAGLALKPPLPVPTSRLNPSEARALTTLAHWKLLPESYLFGAADVRLVGEHYQSYLLGHIYRHGVWFYFPTVLTIKCTEALLALLLTAIAAIILRRMWWQREIVFLVIPAVVCLGIPMAAHLNTGVRHIMPFYAFLWPLAAGGAYTLARGRCAWALIAAGALHIAVSVATFHEHIPFANFLWGGPNATHRLLTDSNADWGEQLNAIRAYLAKCGVQKCWFAYIGEGATSAADWGVNCTPLPNLDAPGPTPEIPTELDGTVLISADEWSGYLTGDGPLNPYGDFHKMQPTAIINGGVLVYDGRFSVPRLSACVRRLGFNELLKSDPRAALDSANQIVALDPENADSWTVLGRANAANGLNGNARTAFEHAISVAQTVKPEFQEEKVPGIKEMMLGL